MAGVADNGPKGNRAMKISKKVGISIFSLVGLLLAIIIIVHQNPGPGVNLQEELIKKIISCVVIVASCIIFAV